MGIIGRSEQPAGKQMDLRNLNAFSGHDDRELDVAAGLEYELGANVYLNGACYRKYANEKIYLAGRAWEAALGVRIGGF